MSQCLNVPEGAVLPLASDDIRPDGDWLDHPALLVHSPATAGLTARITVPGPTGARAAVFHVRREGGALHVTVTRRIGAPVPLPRRCRTGGRRRTTARVGTQQAWPARLGFPCLVVAAGHAVREKDLQAAVFAGVGDGGLHTGPPVFVLGVEDAEVDERGRGGRVVWGAGLQQCSGRHGQSVASVAPGCLAFGPVAAPDASGTALGLWRVTR
ncbi:hypothetical protein GCM10010339_92220 [Streptomyces alanosinicus]|uniref:Uncharacterized protein n=1 Tax=Streptomyces alanosinicus TaxID=68171 RepID=A0A919D884_9ACTN|nr:hypothetical protein GCM10010339_92220 [Streptomyces alanosinicus]